RQMQGIQPAVLFDLSQHLFHVARAVWSEDVVHDFMHVLFLVRMEIRDGNAWELAAALPELNRALVGCKIDQCGLSLLAIEHLENLVSSLRLMPEKITGVTGIFSVLERVTVEDRSAKRHVICRIAPAAHGYVPPRHHPFVLAGTWVVEHCNVID